MLGKIKGDSSAKLAQVEQTKMKLEQLADDLIRTVESEEQQRMATILALNESIAREMAEIDAARTRADRAHVLLKTLGGE